MASILIIQTAFLGDVILSTSLVESWKQKYPEDSVDVLVRKGNESVFANHPKIREVLIWDKKKNKLRNLFALIFEIRKRSYDRVINLQRFVSTGLLTVLSGAKKTIGFHKNPFSVFFSQVVRHEIGKSQNVHEIERNHQLISHETGLKPALPKMYVPDLQTFVSLVTINGPYITVSPASVWFTKQLPAEIWIHFLSQLPDHLQIFLLGGPDDKILCNDISRQVLQKKPSTSVQNLSGLLGIPQSAALMKHALMNYVNDSAPLHMASAVNAPVCAVFCSTIPEFGFGPLSDHAHIVQNTLNLKCRPCGLHGKKACPEGHFKCAKDIRDEQLLEVLNA
ncbi:MAG: glycosyltransferase family 9 protein [Saprospiraceae bacterium]|nr:glycosyltransferase family 9 protein [Saprospiraceae bacterium]